MHALLPNAFGDKGDLANGVFWPAWCPHPCLYHPRAPRAPRAAGVKQALFRSHRDAANSRGLDGLFLPSWRACHEKAFIFVFAESEEIALTPIKALTFLWKSFEAAESFKPLAKKGAALKKQKQKQGSKLESWSDPTYALNVLTNLKYAASRRDATDTDVAVSPTVQKWGYNIQDTSAPTSPLGRPPRERAATPRSRMYTLGLARNVHARVPPWNELPAGIQLLIQTVVTRDIWRRHGDDIKHVGWCVWGWCNINSQFIIEIFKRAS